MVDSSKNAVVFSRATQALIEQCRAAKQDVLDAWSQDERKLREIEYQRAYTASVTSQIAELHAPIEAVQS